MKMYIARDKFGALSVFNHKPYLEDGLWWPDRDIDEYGEWPLDFDEYPGVTFENSPMEVELKLVNNDQDVSNEE